MQSTSRAGGKRRLESTVAHNLTGTEGANPSGSGDTRRLSVDFEHSQMFEAVFGCAGMVFDELTS